MTETAFKLIITDVGYQKLNKILGQGGQIPISQVAVGDKGSGTYHPPTHTSTSLTNLKDSYAPTLVEYVPDHPSQLRINATIPQSSRGGSYSINEIGLMLSDGGQNYLFAIYGSDTSLGQKVTTIDFLLDFIIDLEGFSQQGFETGEYQPQFSMSEATQDNYGIVRYATLSDAILQVQDRVLTTSLLSQSRFIPRTCIGDRWELINQIQVSPGSFAGSQVPIGAYYSQNDTISFICDCNVMTDSHFFYQLYYTISTNNLVDGGFTGNFPTINTMFHSATSCKEKEWFLIGSNGIYAKLVLNEDGNYDMDHSYNKNIGGDWGRICIFNDSRYIVGGYNSPSTHIAKATGDTESEDSVNTSFFNLSTARSKPAVQVVNHHIYSFGGVGLHPAENETMEYFNIWNTSCSGSSKLGIGNPFSWVTSSVSLRSCVYLFETTSGGIQARGGNDWNYYVYDINANISETRTIPSELIPEASNFQGVAVATLDKIYLLINYQNTPSDPQFYKLYACEPAL